MAARASVTTACWEERDPQGGVAQLAESWGAISIEPPATLTPSCLRAVGPLRSKATPGRYELVRRACFAVSALTVNHASDCDPSRAIGPVRLAKRYLWLDMLRCGSVSYLPRNNS